MNKKLALLLLSTSLLSFYSCKKDKKPEVITDKLTLLTSKSWKPALVDKAPDTAPASDRLYYPVVDCELDDSYTFAGNKVAINRGKNKCGDDEQSQEQKSLSIDLDNNKLTIDGTPYTIVEISDKQLKYYATLPFVNGFKTVVFIFEH